MFAIGIDSTLTEEVSRLYPRLLRTTQAALSKFEEAWHIRFNEEETGLIAVIFGAWLDAEKRPARKTGAVANR